MPEPRKEEEYYTAIAGGYDELHGEEQDEKLAEFLSKIEILQNLTLLDVGCGTGRSARLLEGVSWFGIEPSWGMIDQATPETKLRIQHGHAESLPWPDANFDIVLSLTSLQNFMEPARGIEEMHRVCKPNGLIMLSFLKKSPKHKELDELIKRSLHVRESWEQEKDMMYLCQKS